MDRPVSPQAKVLGVAILVIILVTIIAVIYHVSHAEQMATRSRFSVGYQIGPDYLSESGSSWAGVPYALSPTNPGAPAEKVCRASRRDRFTPFAAPDDGPRGATEPPTLIYTPPFTSDLRGDHPNWWQKDGGSYGLPPAAERPDFWAGDATLHTYHARDVIPPLCDASAMASNRRRPSKDEQVAKWQYYGGPKGWSMSPYF